MKHKPPKKVVPAMEFSDHALIRFCERVLGYELLKYGNEFYEKYLSKKIKEKGGKGDVEIEFEDGLTYKFVVRNYTVITVYEIN